MNKMTTSDSGQHILRFNQYRFNRKRKMRCQPEFALAVRITAVILVVLKSRMCLKSNRIKSTCFRECVLLVLQICFHICTLNVSG